MYMIIILSFFRPLNYRVHLPIMFTQVGLSNCFCLSVCLTSVYSKKIKDLQGLGPTQAVQTKRRYQKHAPKTTNKQWFIEVQKWTDCAPGH